MNRADATGARDEVAAGTVTAPRRGAARPVPVRNPELAHLTLAALRHYRKALSAEEGRVSYWRRLLQARLDVVRAVDDGIGAADGLRDILGGVSVQSSRMALLDTVAAGDMPLLPHLPELWGREPVPGDSEHNVELTLALEEAERRLSDYRSALIARLESATGELIARYRDEPTACLIALPVRPQRPVAG